MASNPGRSDSTASRICMTFPFCTGSSGGGLHLFGEEAYQWRRCAVRRVESEPLVAALGRGEQGALRQQDRLRARASHQLVDRGAVVREAAPEEHAFADIGVELDAGR